MKTHKYVGPVSTLELSPTDTRALVTGQAYDDFPIDHPVVQTLIAKHLLIETDASAPPKKTVSESETDDSAQKTTPKPTGSPKAK